MGVNVMFLRAVREEKMYRFPPPEARFGRTCQKQWSGVPVCGRSPTILASAPMLIMTRHANRGDPQ